MSFDNNFKSYMNSRVISLDSESFGSLKICTISSIRRLRRNSGGEYSSPESLCSQQMLIVVSRTSRARSRGPHVNLNKKVD